MTLKSGFPQRSEDPAVRHSDLLVYVLGKRLYVNLTNRCTARCVFCRREDYPVAAGYDLRLETEHPADAYLRSIGDPTRYAEIVFCGFGEPTLRLAEMLEISRALKRLGAHLRLNTNGHGNRIHGRNIVPDLAPYLDEVSISINAPDAASYERIVRPDIGNDAFEAVLEFTRACIGQFPVVSWTVVDLPVARIEDCRRLAESLGVQFRRREYLKMVGTHRLEEGEAEGCQT